VLIMAATTRTAATISEYLSALDPELPAGAQGRSMMETKLRRYLWWKAKLDEGKGNGRKTPGAGAAPKQAGSDAGLNEALKKKDREKADRTANRRRIRGAAPSTIASSSRTGSDSTSVVESAGVGIPGEAEIIAEL
jgi:DNA excision repair protein ERCC-4